MRTILLFAFVTFASVDVNGQANWELKKDANGIKIYTRAAEGTAIKSVRATLEFDVPLEAIIALVMDVSSYHTWVYQCKESTLIKQLGPRSVIYRHVTDAPWPFDDRDHISTFTIETDETTHITTMKSHLVTGVYPEQKGYVRLKRSQASWTFKPVSENKVAATYELAFDPEGNIPAWLINLFITEGPYQSLSNMKAKARDKKYMDAVKK
jgi:ribosome-associated toxin RatA of RatAB toxin-antitoxin module